MALDRNFDAVVPVVVVALVDVEFDMVSRKSICTLKNLQNNNFHTAFWIPYFIVHAFLQATIL